MVATPNKTGGRWPAMKKTSGNREQPTKILGTRFEIN